MFRKLELFPSSGEVGKMPTLLGPLERLIEVSSLRPNRVGVFPLSPEDGNKFCFRNIVFNCFSCGRWTKSITPVHLNAWHCYNEISVREFFNLHWLFRTYSFGRICIQFVFYANTHE
jgi:hypothetical protein